MVFCSAACAGVPDAVKYLRVLLLEIVQHGVMTALYGSFDVTWGILGDTDFFVVLPKSVLRRHRLAGLIQQAGRPRGTAETQKIFSDIAPRILMQAKCEAAERCVI